LGIQGAPATDILLKKPPVVTSDFVNSLIYALFKRIDLFYIHKMRMTSMFVRLAMTSVYFIILKFYLDMQISLHP
jgi:hypothetical protein